MKLPQETGEAMQQKNSPVRLITDCDPSGRGAVIQYYDFTSKKSVDVNLGLCWPPAAPPAG